MAREAEKSISDRAMDTQGKVHLDVARPQHKRKLMLTLSTLERRVAGTVPTISPPALHESTLTEVVTLSWTPNSLNSSSFPG